MKKILSTVLTLTLFAGLYGCGSSDSANDSDSPLTEEDSAITTTEAPTELSLYDQLSSEEKEACDKLNTLRSQMLDPSSMNVRQIGYVKANSVSIGGVKKEDIKAPFLYATITATNKMGGISSHTYYLNPEYSGIKWSEKYARYEGYYQLSATTPVLNAEKINAAFQEKYNI